MGFFNNPANDVAITILRTKRGRYIWRARRLSTKKFFANGSIRGCATAAECENEVRTMFSDVKSVTHGVTEGVRKAARLTQTGA